MIPASSRSAVKISAPAAARARVVHWFTGNIGYHHLHHLAPRIPNYRRRAAFLSNPLLQRAPSLTLFTSLECARRKLWDEERQRMIGFPA